MGANLWSYTAGETSCASLTISSSEATAPSTLAPASPERKATCARPMVRTLPSRLCHDLRVDGLSLSRRSSRAMASSDCGS